MKENRIYSNSVLDNNYEHLFKEKCLIIKKNYSERELNLIHYNDMFLMGEFLIKLKPLSHARDSKKTILKYLDIYIDYNQPLFENRPFINDNLKNYLFKVNSNLVKYGFTNKGTYNIVLVVLLAIELVIIFFIKLSFYKIPILSVLLFVYIKLSQARKRKEGKLLKLY